MKRGMAWVRAAYGVPAKRGMRILFHDLIDDDPRPGTIRSAQHGMLRIQLDGDKVSRPFRPAWNIEYPKGSSYDRV